LLTLASPPSPVLADDLGGLGGAFEKARGIIHDWSPRSSTGGRVRDEREDRSSQPSASPSVPTDNSRQVEQQRIRDNLGKLSAELDSASRTPRAGPENQLFSTVDDQMTATVRKQQLDVLIRSGDVLTAQRMFSAARDKARQDAAKVRQALMQGTKPPFRPLWDFYQYNRPIAYGLLPDENRCAVVLSMALGLTPRPGETSVQDLGNKEIVANLVGPMKTLLVEPVKDAEIASRPYVKAQDLAERIKSEFGPPVYLAGKDARQFLAGKQGIVFLQHAYLHLRGRTGDHIDLWDSNHIASQSTTPFEKAERVWFWPIDAH
jgi:hypothetical protein